MARSAAQKANDKRLAAMGRAMARNRRGAARAPAAPRGGGGGGHKTHARRYGLVETAGGVSIAWGLAGRNTTTYTAGQSLWAALHGQNTAADVWDNLKQSIPIVGTDPGHASQRGLIAGGVLAVGLGRLSRRIPLTRGIARLGMKLDRKVRVTLA